MAILKIRTYPDPVLRVRAEEVIQFDSQLRRLSEDMLETMYDAPGVGLAANQVGIPSRVFVLDVDYQVEGEDEKTRKVVGKQPRVFVNPQIDSTSGKILFKEGCLSVPGVSEEVSRFEQVSLNYQNVDGQKESIEAHGLLAVAIQHEIDHLDGKLFIDRLSLVRRGRVKSKLKKEQTQKFERSKFHVEL